MTELHQTILMEAMLKYLSTDSDRRKILSHEYELIDAFQQQLNNKEQEKVNALEYIEKIESENKVLANQLAELQQRNENLVKENKQLHDDLITKIKSSNLFLDVHSHNEEELITQVENLKNKIIEGKNEINLLKKDFEQEKNKFEDELFIANQKVLKLSGLEKLVEQQKNKLETVQKINEEKTILETRLEVYELNIQELEKNKDKLLEDCKKLNTQLYSERNEYKEAIANTKRNIEKIKKMESDIQALDEKKKYWEQRARQNEESLQEARMELDALKFADNTESLLSQEQELNYKKTIARLENQLSLMTRDNEYALKVGELEGKLEAICNAHKRKEEEFVLLMRQYDELQRLHSEVLEQLENYKVSEEQSKSKKNKLGMSFCPKVLFSKYSELKLHFEKSNEDYRLAKEELEEMKKQKVKAEEQAKEQTDKVLECEKENIRLKERIAVLLEESNKNDKLIKDLMHQSETVSVFNNN
jgi:chromosome segregation ATPase